MSRHTSSVRPGRRVSSTVRISPGSSTSKDSSSRSTTAVGQAAFGGRLEVSPERIRTEPAGDGSRRPAEQEVRPPFVRGRGDHHGTERVQRRSQCLEGHERRVGQAGSRAPRSIAPPPPPRSGASRSGASVEAPRSRAPPEPGRSPGRSRPPRPPRSPSRRRPRVASKTSSNIARASAPRSSGAQERGQPGLRVAEGLHGEGDRAHELASLAEPPRYPHGVRCEGGTPRNPGITSRRRWRSRRCGSGSGCRTSTWTGSPGAGRRSSRATTSPTSIL